MLNFVGHVEQEDWISESWTEPGKVSDLRAAYAGWHPQVQRVIDAVDETFIWAVLDREPIKRWSFGRVTMLGDACHPMLPFMARRCAGDRDGVAITACLLRSAMTSRPRSALRDGAAAAHCPVQNVLGEQDPVPHARRPLRWSATP